MRPLIIVRPQPGAEASKKAAAALGLRPLVMPLFAVEPMAWRAPDPTGYDGLLLTSANAVRHSGREVDRLRSLPAHCVGEATAEAARRGGFAVASVGPGGVDALLQSLPPGLKLLHLCGLDRRVPAGDAIDALPVYRSVELPCPGGFAKAEGAVVAVHSPRAGSAVAGCVDALGLDRTAIVIAAISADAASAAGSGWAKVEAAPEPTDTALLAIALRLCNNPR